jgi:membrane-bound inhibitor of C-type lysozyme
MSRAIAPLLVAFVFSTSLGTSYSALAQQDEPARQDAIPADTAEPSVINSVRYRCDDGKGFIADYLTNNTVRATFGTRVFILPQVVSGSGIRYSDGSVTLNSKGDEAFVEVGDKILFENCVAVQTVEGQTIEGLW